MGPVEVLRRSRRAAIDAAASLSSRRLRKILARAERDLERRLVESVRSAGEQSFTVAQLKVALAQVKLVAREVGKGMTAELKGAVPDVSAEAADGILRYLRDAERRFSGVVQPLPIQEAALLDRAARGAESSLLHRLEGDPRRGPGILERYGDAVVQKFEENLQDRFVGRKPWAAVRAAITADSPFLQQAPAHWAERIVRTECLLGDTRVSGAVVRAVFRRPFQGDVVEVVTERGRRFTATPNHPMLALRGWVGAGSLRDGDYLVCYRGKQHAGTPGDHHVDDRQMTLDQVFDAASAVGIRERRRTTKPDFHGDGTDGEVEVASPFRALNVGAFAALFEPVAKYVFAPTDLSDLVFCPLCRRLLSIDQQACLCGGTWHEAGFSDPSLDYVRGNVVRGSQVLHTLAPGESLDDTRLVEREDSRGCDSTRRVVSAAGFGRGARTQSSFFEGSQDGRWMDADFGAATLGAHPTEVELDRVVYLRTRVYSGHVYNLQTPHGYYLIGDAYTGNTMNVHGAASLETNKEAASAFGDVVKILSATFDDRTAADSYAVHGQIRRPEEAFDTWQGKVMHPPARPNDREIVVTHRLAWPIPRELRSRSDGEVMSRWRREKRKGAPPPRPLLTTVPLDRFAKS